MSASSSKKVIFAALAGNSLIAITKFIASYITGSSAMLSEGIHSLVDTGNQGLLLYGMKQAEKPASAEFPFGHGKEIYFWSFVVAILVFALGAGVSLYGGIKHIMHPAEIANPLVNYIVLSLAMVFEGAAFFFALKEFKKVKGQLTYFEALKQGKDPSIFVVLFEDGAALLGLVVALIGVFLAERTGIAMFDGIASVVIGVILAVTATFLAIETKGLLIGESADPEIVKAIHAMVDEIDPIERTNEVLTMHMGPNYILVNVSADFAPAASSDEVEGSIAELDKRIKKRFSNVKRIFVEAESREHFLEIHEEEMKL
ncbi:MAG TPA: cation transporter [Leucothrix sp.]|nr:cation transporter [Leucothrix sp.]